jgi:hypothetical protein
MSSLVWERRKLNRLERSLTRSDPNLEALYSLFAQMTRLEVMPAGEQLGGRRPRRRRTRKADRLAAMLGLAPEPPAR